MGYWSVGLLVGDYHLDVVQVFKKPLEVHDALHSNVHRWPLHTHDNPGRPRPFRWDDATHLLNLVQRPPAQMELPLDNPYLLPRGSFLGQARMKLAAAPSEWLVPWHNAADWLFL